MDSTCCCWLQATMFMCMCPDDGRVCGARCISEAPGATQTSRPSEIQNPQLSAWCPPGGAGGGGGVPEVPRALHEARRQAAQGRAADWAPRHRQNPAGARDSRRGRRALLLQVFSFRFVYDIDGLHWPTLQINMHGPGCCSEQGRSGQHLPSPLGQHRRLCSRAWGGQALYQHEGKAHAAGNGCSPCTAGCGQAGP